MRERSERYLLKSLTPAKLVYNKGKAEVEVLLENVSTTGAGLTMYQAPREDEHCRLTFKLGNDHLEVDAQIKWSRESGRGQWLAGCEFKRALGAGILAPAIVESPERRSIARRAIMRRECAPEYPYRVELRDCSSGGVGIVSDEPFDLGESVILELEDQKDAQFLVRAQWSDKQDGQTVVGFRFEVAGDAERFMQAAGYAQTTARPVAPVLGTSVFVLAGTVAAAAVVILNGCGIGALIR